MAYPLPISPSPAPLSPLPRFIPTRIVCFASGTFSGPHFIAADNGLPSQLDGLDITGPLP